MIINNDLEQYTIDILTEAHFKECIDIYIDSYSKDPWNEKYSVDSVYQYLKKQVQISHFLGFVLVLNAKVIGQAFGFIMPTAINDYYRIEDFCIRPKYQNKGAGSRFIELICDYVRGMELDTILLNTVRDFPSYTFYKKNGFVGLEESSTLLLKL